MFDYWEDSTRQLEKSKRRMSEMRNIAIVGLGVVGGSFAKALRKHPVEGERILAIDPDEETLKKALEEGVIDEGETSNQRILQQADIVIIGLYPLALKEFIKVHRDDFKEGAILTDVAGVKGVLVEQLMEEIPEQVDFIYGHPMAGRENRGYAYADAEVFEGANYLLTPTEKNKKENLERLEKLITRIGFKRVTLVNPKKHDEMIAFTSQLCHVIAVSLINSDDPERGTVKFIGDSYRDLTRIAKINESLWSELFIENKVELLDAIEGFEKQFQTMKKAIQEEDSEQMESMFRESTKRRIQLEADDKKKR